MTAVEHNMHEGFRKGSLMAVIDIGSTAIRMAVAERGEEGVVRTLDTLQQSVSLGKDVFSRGCIENATIEKCVDALRSFRRVLDGFHLVDPGSIHAVATCAVREAANRDAFLDRLYIATRITVDMLDATEVNRLTYLAVQPLLVKHDALRRGRLLVIEVGGGSTEVIGLEDGQVQFSQTFDLGALRLREAAEGERPSARRVMRTVENQVRMAVSHIHQYFHGEEPVRVLALGGEMRLAAHELRPDAEGMDIVVLPYEEIAGMGRRMLQQSAEDLVRTRHLSFPDAEALGPALFTCAQFAHELGIEEVSACGVSMRDGLLAEMLSSTYWTGDFSRQIIHSAIELGEKYSFDRAHALQVTRIACRLFDAMQDEHGCTPRHRVLLEVASVLHDIGAHISNRSHHKHSMYLIRNSDLFGLSERDVELCALVARYHRKALPSIRHLEFGQLTRGRRMTTAKLAAILRLADALDRGHNQRIEQYEIGLAKGRIVFTVNAVGDLTLEELAVAEKGDLFEQIYGRTPVLKARDGQAGHAL